MAYQVSARAEQLRRDRLAFEESLSESLATARMASTAPMKLWNRLFSLRLMNRR